MNRTTEEQYQDLAITPFSLLEKFLINACVEVEEAECFTTSLGKIILFHQFMGENTFL